jgi:hypothetical protein
MRNAKLILISFFLLWASGTPAQTKRPAPTRNAALRYWMAFAEMQDPPTDKATADLLEKTAAGEAPWDEVRLGPILDKNEDGILAMQRATKLPECDWGLEYDRGPSASIAYVPRARVLARLNTLYGMRLAAKGKTQEAVDTWLAGIRFSQHLAQGGSLIFSLVGKIALLSNFQALTQAAQNGAFTDGQRKQLMSTVRALPDTGFDWGEAFWYEQDPLDVAVKQVSQASNPSTYFQQISGRPAPENFTPPKSADIAAYHKLTGAVEKALRQPPEQARDKLKTLQDATQNLHPFYQALMPSFTRVNESRAEVQAARGKLLQALSSN